MSLLSPASILYDSSGNAVGVVLDGAVYRLQTQAKIVRASDGAQINPATEDTLALIKNTDGIKKIVDALPIGDNNIGNVDLASSIPTGSNEIGKVAQGTRAAASAAWPEYLTDASGNVVGVILDGAIYRLQTEAKQAGTWTVQQGTPPWAVEGTVADGAPPTENPVLVAGQDGTNVQTLKTDTVGRPEIVGAAADGATPSGAPVLTAGQDGTNVQSIKTDTTGRQEVIGGAADGATPAGNPVLVAGQDGTNVQTLFTDDSGRQRIVGAASDGAAVTGDPVLVGGQDGTNAQSLLVDTAGRPRIVGAGPDGSAVVGDPVVTAGVDGSGNTQAIKTNTAGRIEGVVFDGSGNAIGVVLDGALYRFQVDAKVAKGASALVHLDAIDTTSGQGRLKSTLYTPEGDPVTFGSIPPDPTSIQNAFVLNGSSDSLLVNGSGTPVVFSYDADATDDISVQELRFTLASNSITFGGGYFGATAGPLTNGLLVEITSNGNTGTLATLKQNEDFVNFASPGGFTWVVSSKDLMSSNLVVGGAFKLHAGTSDKIKVTVRDNISAAGVYFKGFVKGNLLGVS